MAATTTGEPEVIHRLKNQLAIVVGFSQLLLEEFPTTDQRRADLLALYEAAQNAFATVPELARQIRHD